MKLNLSQERESTKIYEFHLEDITGKMYEMYCFSHSSP